jgi:hypothetical protein
MTLTVQIQMTYYTSEKIPTMKLGSMHMTGPSNDSMQQLASDLLYQ